MPSKRVRTSEWVVKRWTPEREQQLIKLWGDDVTPTFIAQHMECSLTSVTAKAHQLGLPRRMGEWTDELIEQLRKLWADGDSASQIAKQLGKTRNSVLGKANRLHLDPRAVARSSLSTEEKAAHAIKRRESQNAWMRLLRAENRGEVQPRTRKEPKPPPHVWRGSLNVPLDELGPLFDASPNECRYTYSPGSPFLFCGQPTKSGSSWCDHCADIVFGRVTVEQALAA